ncbi:hypothetical protein PGT21_020062 [Puccinia graminis f. sp. tritici]|uniref:Uncharacterized protein n=1 Tax=Puccinia graminis f. sp. tritici TaxID=56615 RepID=A0A5B0PLL3_PUCGR|nr:hypothetical protein PGT21_020062 [Puccinia graminis f. sp. tritici]KAA1136541.1 hypothetical protein PGTUg99_034967 [Puccinia graminis f. sp. tritici]
MQVLSAVVLLAVVCNYASAWSFPCNKEAGLTEGVCQMNPPAFGTDPKVQKFVTRAEYDHNHPDMPFACSSGWPKCCPPAVVKGYSYGEKMPNADTSNCHDVPKPHTN